MCSGDAVHTGEPEPAAQGRTAELAPVSAAEPEPPPEPPPLIAAAEPEPPLPWSSLLPIYYVRATTDGVLYVEVPETDAKVANRFPKAYMSAVEFAVNDKRVPARVTAVADATIVLLRGKYDPAPPIRVHFSSSPFGDAWSMAFPYRGDETEGIALARAPHPDAALHRPSEEGEATPELRKLLAEAVPRRFRPGQNDELSIEIEIAPARLPGGATRVVSGSWTAEYGPAAPGVVMAIDDAGRRVHTISGPDDNPTWASIVWVGDLDGDGIDEIGWGHGDIEDEAYFVTHFADGKQELIRLYAAGH